MAGENLLLVLSNPTADQDAAFNAWYEEVHVHEVVAVPGVVAARRYDLLSLPVPEVEGVSPPPPPAHRYLALYEVEGDPAEVQAEFVRQVTSGEMTLHPALDMSTLSMGMWTPRGPRVTSVPAEGHGAAAAGV
jgi:hypothetical protein